MLYQHVEWRSFRAAPPFSTIVFSRWHLGAAPIPCRRTAAVEWTKACFCSQGGCLPHTVLYQRTQQRFGIGMIGSGKHLRRNACFQHSPATQNKDTVTGCRSGNIVGDDQLCRIRKKFIQKRHRLLLARLQSAAWPGSKVPERWSPAGPYRRTAGRDTVPEWLRAV